MKEKYKIIKGYENYEISNLGHVRSVKKDKLLKPTITKSGRLRIGLYAGGKHKSFYIDVLTYKTFIGDFGEDEEIKHIDGDVANNKLENLFVDSKYEYNIGDEVNGLKIVKQYRNKTNNKAYKVQSLEYPNTPVYEVLENALKRGCGDAYVNGNRRCEENSLYSYEYIRPFLIDIEQAKTITPYDNIRKYVFKCPDCNKRKKTTPAKLMYEGFSCSVCSANISYPELFFGAFNEYFDLGFTSQQTLENFKGYRFDFVNYNTRTIVETHGMQHYQDVGGKGGWKNSYDRTQQSDIDKRKYCKENNLVLIELDCRKSDFEFIANNINKNKNLKNIGNEDKKHILKIIERNKRYPIRDIIKQYKSGDSTYKIGEKYNLSNTTISKILKQNNIKLVGKAKYPHLPIEKIIKEYREGVATSQIGETYNISASTVRSILKRNGVKLRKRGHK